MIYFLQSEPGGDVKIGTTTCLTRRRKQLDKEYKTIFSVIGVLDGGYAEEHALHLKFAQFHVEGEFFRWHPAIKDFISNECRLWDGIDERPYGTLIRVTDEFAEAIKEASSLEKLSVADFATAHLLPIVTKRYRDTLVSKARKAEGKG